MNLDRLLLYKEDARDRVFLAIIKALLRQGNHPCTPRELSNIILKSNLATLGGSTPFATVSSRISQHLRRAKRLGREPLLGKKLQDGCNARRMVYYVRENTSPSGNASGQNSPHNLNKMSTVLFSMLVSGNMPGDVASKIYGSSGRRGIKKSTKSPIVTKKSLRRSFLLRPKRSKPSMVNRKKRMFIQDLDSESAESSNCYGNVQDDELSPVSNYSTDNSNSYSYQDQKFRRGSTIHDDLDRWNIQSDKELLHLCDSYNEPGTESPASASSIHDLSDFNLLPDSDDSFSMFSKRMQKNDSFMSYFTEDIGFRKDDIDFFYPLRQLIFDPDCKQSASDADSAYATPPSPTLFPSNHLAFLNMPMIFGESASDVVPLEPTFMFSSGPHVLGADLDSSISFPLNDGIETSDSHVMPLSSITSDAMRHIPGGVLSTLTPQNTPQIDIPDSQSTIDMEIDKTGVNDTPVTKLDYILSDPKFVSYRSLFGNVFSTYESNAVFGVVSMDNDATEAGASELATKEIIENNNLDRTNASVPVHQKPSNISITVTGFSHVAQIAMVAHAPAVVLPLSYVLVSKDAAKIYTRRHPSCKSYTHLSVNLTGYVRARELMLCAHLSQHKSAPTPQLTTHTQHLSHPGSDDQSPDNDSPPITERKCASASNTFLECNREVLEVYKGELMSWALRSSLSGESFAVCVIGENETDIDKGFILVGLSSSTVCLDASAGIPVECQGVWIPSIDAVKVEPSFVDFIAAVESTYNISASEGTTLNAANIANAELSDLSFSIPGKNIVPMGYDSRSLSTTSITNSAGVLQTTSAQLAQSIGFDSDPFRPENFEVSNGPSPGISCNVMVRKCPKGGFFFRPSKGSRQDSSTLESGVEISRVTDPSNCSITIKHVDAISTNENRRGKVISKPTPVVEPKQEVVDDSASEEAQMLLPSKCIRDLGFVLSLNPVKQKIPDIALSDVYVSYIDGVAVYMIWVDVFEPAPGTVSSQFLDYENPKSSSRPSRGPSPLPPSSVENEKASFSVRNEIGLKVKHRCKPKRSCFKLVQLVGVPDSIRSPTCIPVMRRIDNDMISAMPFLYSLGLRSEVGRNIALSPESGLVSHKQKNSPLYGIWVPLKSARNLAEIFGSNPRVSSILSDSLCEVSPMVMRALKCYSELCESI